LQADLTPNDAGAGPRRFDCDAHAQSGGGVDEVIAQITRIALASNRNRLFP